MSKSAESLDKSERVLLAGVSRGPTKVKSAAWALVNELRHREVGADMVTAYLTNADGLDRCEIETLLDMLR